MCMKKVHEIKWEKMRNEIYIDYSAPVCAACVPEERFLQFIFALMATAEREI